MSCTISGKEWGPCCTVLVVLVRALQKQRCRRSKQGSSVVQSQSFQSVRSSLDAGSGSGSLRPGETLWEARRSNVAELFIFIHFENCKTLLPHYYYSPLPSEQMILLSMTFSSVMLSISEERAEGAMDSIRFFHRL